MTIAETNTVVSVVALVPLVLVGLALVVLILRTASYKRLAQHIEYSFEVPPGAVGPMAPGRYTFVPRNGPDGTIQWTGPVEVARRWMEPEELATVADDRDELINDAT